MSRGNGVALGRRTASAVVLLLAFVLLLSLPLPYTGHSPTLLPSHAPALSHSPAEVALPPVRAVTPAPIHAVAPAPSVSCPTPSNAPNWNGNLNFFHDALVTFWTPGSPSLSGSNFQIAPCTGNLLPTYTNGFWMNVSTNVPLTSAVVRVWATGWPTTSDPAPAVQGFTPQAPAAVPMHILGPTYHQASFYFNNYRFFWPGTHVYFNLTLQSTNATPSTIYSARANSIPVNFPGGTNNATWAYTVQAPWASTNFSNDILVSTSPSVLTQPAFEPNPAQPITITISAFNLSGGAAIPIPKANLTVLLTKSGTSQPFGTAFGPENHTSMSTVPIGPYPGYTMAFSITAWLPWWGGGAIDKITSPTFQFNWSANGGWWAPQYGVEGNLNYTTSPNVLGQSPSAVLPTGTPVNVSVHEPIENVTISSAALHFHYWDLAGSVNGSVPMTAANQNTSFAVIPGLPAGAHVTFSVVVKDVFQNPISSGNTTYGEDGPFAIAPPPTYGLFYFEAVDISGTGLVPNLNFSLSNGSWSESRTASPFGFGYPLPASGPGALAVHYGSAYVLTIRAFGQTETATFTVASSDPFVIVFYLASGSVSPSVTASPTFLIVPGVIGLVAAGVAMKPLSDWFKERRRKTEEEQRRITL